MILTLWKSYGKTESIFPKDQVNDLIIDKLKEIV